MKDFIKISGVLLISIISSMLNISSLGAEDNESKPVGHWSLCEGFGDTANDSSSYHTNGKILGAKWAKGPLGACLEFAEPGNFVAIPSRNIFCFDEEFSISAWIYPLSINEGTIVSKDGNGHLSGYSFDISNGSLSVVIKTEKNANGRTGYSAVSPKVLKEKTWSNVAVTYSTKENKLKLFHNGEIVKEIPANGKLQFKTVWEDGIFAPLTIGANSNFPCRYSQFLGLIRDVKVYNLALAESAIKKDYEQTEPQVAKIKVATAQDRELATLTCELSGKVIDADTKELLDAHVKILVNGKYYYPEKETLYWGNRKNASFISSQGGFSVKIPSGKAEIIADRGLEYLSLIKQIELKGGDKKELVLEMKKLVDMPSLGWYGGEHHLHSTGHGKGQVYEFMERPDGWIWWASAVKAAGFHYVSSPTGHPKGNCEAACSDKFICAATWEGGPLADETSKIWKGTSGGGICMMNDIDAAEKEGAMAIPQGYIEDPLADGNFFNPAIFAFDRSFPMVVALDKAYIWDVYYRSGKVTQNDWYRYLNTGFKLGIGHGSDAYLSQGPAPETKEYVKLDALTWPDVIKGYKKRATFFSSGPLVIFKINGKDVGDTVNIAGDKTQDLNVSIEAWDKSALSKVEIIKNGEIEKTIDFEDKPQHVKQELQLPVKDSCWIALRIYGGGFAHTSPIYIQYGDNPMKPKKEDIDYFLTWLGKYRQFIKERLNPKQPAETKVTEKDAEQVLQWIDKAEKVYQGLLVPANYRRW